MPLNRANNVIFGTATNYALPNQSLLDPLQRWYGLSSNSLTINPYGYITGTGNYGTSNTISPHFDINGNFTVNFAYVGTELQTNTLKIGTSNNTENYISFRGTTGDEPGNFTHTFIGERLYGGTENSELLLFKGNDIEGVSGPDRIRLFANNHVFDTYTVNPVSGTFASVGATGQAVTRMIIKENGNIGIGTITPNTIATSSTPAMLGIVSNAVGTTGLVIRAIASQTANLQEWQNSAGTVLAKVNYYGGAEFIDLKIGTTSSLGVLSVTPGTTSQKGLVIRGLASQTANLQEWSDSTGTYTASMDQYAQFKAVKLTTSNYITGITSTSANIQFQAGYGIVIRADAAEYIPLVLRGVASQTANLQEWQDSVGTVLAKVTASGGFELNGKDIEIMNIMGAL